MHFLRCFFWAVALLVCSGRTLRAQLPFYTDDTGVTEAGKFHFEFFNEYDRLQLQNPNLRQNTANFKLNYGLHRNVELDVDGPYLAIYRAAGSANAHGGGDFDLGFKVSLHRESEKSKVPAFAASLYIEFPTGDTNDQLGSGLTDYALNFIGQKSLGKKTRLTGDAGFLFAGNTSTGVVGIVSTRGHVLTGGLSLVHDFRPKLSLGAEIYGGIPDNGDLGKGQLQILAGGMYNIRPTFAFCFGVLGGSFVATPRIGAQVGFAVDFPGFVRLKKVGR